MLYGRIYLLGLPFLMPYDLSKECVMGCGDSKTPLKVIVATSVMNIVLDLVLVGPFGVAGAAAATAVAQVAGAVYMVAFLRRTQMDAAFSPRMLKARYARDIFRLSAPNSVQQASGTIITTVKQGLLGGLGVEAIAGFSCAGKLSSLLMMPVFGFVQSTVFFIAQNTAALPARPCKRGPAGRAADLVGVFAWGGGGLHRPAGTAAPALYHRPGSGQLRLHHAGL